MKWGVALVLIILLAYAVVGTLELREQVNQLQARRLVVQP